MNKTSQYRVQKHRILHTARKKEFKYVNEIFSTRSNNLENNMSAQKYLKMLNFYYVKF